MSLILLGILNSQAAAAGAAGAYDLLETTDLTSSAANIEISGLSSYTDYKHLQVRGLLKITTALNGLNPFEVEFNNNTSNLYYTTAFRGYGSLGQNNYGPQNDLYFPNALVRGGSSEDKIYGSFVMDILDFSSPTKATSVRTMSGAAAITEKQVMLAGGYFNIASAISSIKIRATSGDLASGCRVSIYGIRGS